MRIYIFLAGCFLLLAACGALAEEREPVLPRAEDLERVAITGGGLDVSITDGSSIARLLEDLERSVLGNTGIPSVRDIPEEGDGLVRIDFGFSSGGTGTVFLCRQGDRLLLEQPFHGIWELDGSLKDSLLSARELAGGQRSKKE